jgi:hypothetical protein
VASLCVCALEAGYQCERVAGGLRGERGLDVECGRVGVEIDELRVGGEKGR